MLRIALFIPGFGGGGAENVFIILANHWVSLGFHVDYLVCNEAGPMRERLDSRVHVLKCSDRGGRLFRRINIARFVAKYCKESQSEFLLSTLTYCNLSALMAKVFWGLGSTRLIIREANSLSNIRKSGRVVAAFNFWMMRFLYPHADWISANSENTLNELEEVIGTPSKKRALVRNPVKLHVVERHPTNAVKTILGCGRLIAQKDFHTLIRAVALVRGKRPCRLVIIGDGPERDELLALSTELGFAEDELSLPGFVANTSEYYSAADVFVLPSKWEGLPNVVLEALSYDLPVVATDCSGGTREIFEGLSDAHLVAVGDVENMALKIEQFCEEPPLAGKMQAILSERYDVATIAASYCELAKSK